MLTLYAEFASSYAANNLAQAAAQSARQKKDDDRAAVVAEVRSVVRRLRAHGEMDDSEAAALGLSVRDTVRTATARPETAPVAQVDTSQRLRHTIQFRDSATPTSLAKPKDVMGCEVWMKVGGPPPSGPAELTYLATDTRSPYTVDFTGAEAGQTAHYMLRWVNTRHEPGPWSATASSTITG